MAPLPTITGVYRVTFVFPTNLGVAPRFVMHFLNIAGDEEELGTAIENSWQAHQLEPMSQAYDCTQLDIIKLDGHSATVPVVISAGTIKGEQVGSDQIPQAAAVVSYHTNQRGPRGRGRTYVGPITESSQANGVLSTTIATHMQTAWTDFLDGMASSDYSGVVASYAHSDANGIIAASIDSLIGTQRRRLNQLR